MIARRSIPARVEPSPPSVPGETGGAARLIYPDAKAVSSYRVAVHEAGHAIVARILDWKVHFATVIADVDLGYGGCVWAGGGEPDRKQSLRDGERTVFDVTGVVDQHMPRHGEDREDAESWFFGAFHRVVETLAGAAAENLIFGEYNERACSSDYLKAARYAQTICTSDRSAWQFLEFARSEAEEMLSRYRSVLVALASALQERKEMDGAAIDQVIMSTLAHEDLEQERRRRAYWAALR
ncbi:hypothetical protein [Bradyrhizobium macuxiense]|nr:hypothetical protein [Bradyrhizobium macuxiense]